MTKNDRGVPSGAPPLVDSADMIAENALAEALHGIGLDCHVVIRDEVREPTYLQKRAGAALLAALHDAGWTLVRQDALDSIVALTKGNGSLPTNYREEVLRLARALRGDDR